MEETKELYALLERMERAGQKQIRYARLQCVFSAVAAVCCAAALVLVAGLLPKLDAIARQADVVMQDVQQVSSQLAQADWEGMISDLEQVGAQIAQADFGALTQEVSTLVQSSQSGVEEALGKLNSIDLDTLNRAIADLAAVVEPLAKFFGRF